MDQLSGEQETTVTGTECVDAHAFRARHGLDGLERPSLICSVNIGRAGALASEEVLLTLADYVRHQRVGGVSSPACERFCTPETFIEYYEAERLTRNRIVVIVDGKCGNSCIKLLFAGLAGKQFPGWADGRALFCGRVPPHCLERPTYVHSAARRLFDAFVNQDVFNANMKRFGLPYGQPPRPLRGVRSIDGLSAAGVRQNTRSLPHSHYFCP